MMDTETPSDAHYCAPDRGNHTQNTPLPAGKGAQRKRSLRAQASQLEDLPQPGVTRWVIRRKAQVVAAVQAGSISLEEVCERYLVSVEEFQSWQKLLERHGIYGLRSTRSQIYRSTAGKEKR